MKIGITRRTVAATIGVSLLSSRNVFAANDLTLVYIGAKDCPSCASWKRSQWPAFAASPEFKKLQFRQVEAPTIKQAYDIEFWPEDLHPQHDFLVGKKAFGTPNFFLLRGRRMLHHFSGVSGWTNKMWPEIQVQTASA